MNNYELFILNLIRLIYSPKLTWLLKTHSLGLGQVINKLSNLIKKKKWIEMIDNCGIIFLKNHWKLKDYTNECYVHILYVIIVWTMW